MPTNFKKREKQAAQSDAIRGQQAMNRLTGVVRREQRMQAKSGSRQTDTTFNSQPQVGWKKEWKTTLAGKADSSNGPDTAWTDEQAWLQGSGKCYDSRRPVPATKAAGDPSIAFSGKVPAACTSGGVSTSTRKSASILPSLPVLPEQRSRTEVQKYLAEVTAALQCAVLDSSIQPDADELRWYTAEFALALRELTKPAPVSQKARICEAMASVWDVRSNSAPTTGAPVDLRALADALET